MYKSLKNYVNWKKKCMLSKFVPLPHISNYPSDSKEGKSVGTKNTVTLP